MGIGELDETAERCVIADGSRRVVREVDGDQARRRRDRRRDRGEVELPAGLAIERDAGCAADRERERLHRLVVRRDHDGVLARLDQRSDRAGDRFLGAREAEHVGRLGQLVGVGDRLPHGRRPVGLAIAESEAPPGGELLVVGELEQLGDGQRLRV